MALRSLGWTALLLVSAAATAAADTTTADLDELEKKPTGYWALSFHGGAAFPLKTYADSHDEALGASAALSYTGTSGLGVGVHAGYSPLPIADDSDDPDFEGTADNHVAHAALAPRFTLGKKTLRLFVGAGGGVLFEKAAVTRTAAAALAQAGLELHILGAGGVTVGGSYVRTLANATAQLATAHAGFVMTF